MFGLLDAFLMWVSWNPTWARCPIEVLTTKVKDCGQLVECVVNGANFYESGRVDNNRI